LSAWKSGSCGSVKRPIGSVMLGEQRAVPAALRLPSRLPRVRVRKAGQEDRATVARLLYESAPDMYERFSGGHDRALATLERAFDAPGNLASSEVAFIAEVDGAPAAAMAAFPVSEAGDRSRAYMDLTLRNTPVWRWPGVLRLYWTGGRASPKPREDSFYIDALATDPAFRRRGAARALLEEAERQARAHGLPAVSLDTTLNNEGARALYAQAGFDEVAYRAESRGLPGFVALVKPLQRA
jgi:ribosomal protein S18 acetylase RimI-like enzyme